MTSSVMARAKYFAEGLTRDGFRATHDIGKALTQLPCILVVPAPRLTFETIAGGSATAEWTLVALHKQPANEKAVEQLLEHLAHMTSLIPEISDAYPDAYPVGDVDLPAYIATFKDPDLLEL